jgi:hypothetical protein
VVNISSFPRPNRRIPVGNGYKIKPALRAPVRAIFVFFAFLIVSGAQTSSSAKAVKIWTPDELYEKATFVCNGLVLENTAIDPGSFKGRGPSEARIKVLSVFKGDKADIIDLKYSSAFGMDASFFDPLVKGKRYRFYLTKSSDESYAPWNPEDACSIILMSGEENDDSRPLSESAAIRIGTDYFNKRFANREVIFSETSAVYKGYGDTKVPTWSVSFWKIYPSDPRFVEQTFVIIVKDDGTVDEAGSGNAHSPALRPAKVRENRGRGNNS